MSIVFIVLALVPAQEASERSDPAGDAPPPLVELAPTAPVDPVQEAPPKATAPPVLKPAPTPDKKKAPPVDAQGIAQPGLAAIQVAAGTGACCAGCCLSVPFVFGLALVPVVGGVASAMASNIIVGTSIGVAETWAGDAWGTQRGAMIWPVLASVGILTSSTLLSTAAAIVEPPVIPNPNDPNALANAFTGGGPLTTIANAYSLFACAGAIVLPAAVYAFTATDKQPGDTGSGFPGIMEPAHPKVSPTTVAMASSSEPPAMRY